MYGMGEGMKERVTVYVWTPAECMGRIESLQFVESICIKTNFIWEES